MNIAISHKHKTGNGAGGARARRPALFRRIIALVMMALLGGVAALSMSAPAQAAEEDDTANYSFYQLSSSLAAFFSNASSPDKNAAPITDVWGSVTQWPGSAGSMLGYVDPDFSFSMEFLNSQISGSSSAVGYDTLIQTSNQSEDAGSSSQTPGMLDYAHFGATLNGMGLDSMGTGLSLGFFAPIGGGLMMLFYIFTGLVDLMFAALIGILQWLNPFKLFYAGVNAVSPEFASGMTGGEGASGLFGGLANWIGDWYLVLNNMAWTVIVPLFVGVLVLGLVLSKNMNRGSAIKKLIIRMVFIGLGLPLIGSMYTGMLNSMGDASESGNSGSTQVVLSTYVDFQNWAFSSRLYVPDGAVIEWDADRSRPTGDSLSKVRNTALEINKTTNKDWAAISSSMNIGESESWTQAALNDGEGDAAGGWGGYMATLDLLGRYVSGSKIDAASYETAVKGDISTQAPFTSGEEGKEKVSSWFTEFSDPKSGLPGITDAEKISGNPVIRVNDDTGLKADPAGATSGDKKYTSPSQFGCESWVSNANGVPLNCNMSTLSLYNYLNTSFGSDSMTMYSSNKSTSGATREMHNSVTQVGTGIMSGLYWANSIVLLASFVIIGIGYAFSIVFATIRRTFQLVTAIPFATLGAIPAIAKVIIYTTAMIMEVILTIFIYKFIQVFLLALPQVMEMPLAAILNTSDDNAATNVIIGGTLSTVMTVISIISLIIFTVLAMRVRKTLVKSVNEVVTKLVDKFLDTNVAPSGKSGAMPALAGGLAQGAGMAAASKAMGGGGGGAGKKPAAGAGTGGPKATAAGGIPPGRTGGPKAGQGPLGIGGGAGMEVSGDVGGNGGNGSGGPDGAGGPDGTGGAPGGDGNSGGPLALTQGSSSGEAGISGSASDQATAQRVAAQGGLSEPGSQGSGDIADSMSGSLEKAQSQYGAKDKAVAGGAMAGGKAAVKGAEAAGRGLAGDAPGAVSAGTSALGHAQDAKGSAKQAQDIQKEIDAPTPSASAGTSGKSGASEGPGKNGSSTPSGSSGGNKAAASLAAGSAAGGAADAAAKGAKTLTPVPAGTKSATGSQAPSRTAPKTSTRVPSGTGGGSTASPAASSGGSGRRAAAASKAPVQVPPKRPNNAPAPGRRSAAPVSTPKQASPKQTTRPAQMQATSRQAQPKQAPRPATPKQAAPRPVPKQAQPRQAPRPTTPKQAQRPTPVQRPKPKPVRGPRKDGDS